MIERTIVITKAGIHVEEGRGNGKAQIIGPGVRMWLKNTLPGRVIDWQGVMAAAAQSVQAGGVRPSTLRYFRTKSHAPKEGLDTYGII